MTRPGAAPARRIYAILLSACIATGSAPTLIAALSAQRLHTGLSSIPLAAALLFELCTALFIIVLIRGPARAPA